MEKFKWLEYRYDMTFMHKIEEICNTGDISALDTCMCSPDGYRLGLADDSQKGPTLLILAIKAVLKHAQWAILDHVLTQYHMPLSKAIEALKVIDSVHPVSHNLQWVERVDQILNHMLLPKLPSDANYIEQIKSEAKEYRALGVWWALISDVDKQKSILTYINTLIPSSRHWVAPIPFWFPFMLQHSDDEYVIQALSLVISWPHNFKASVEKELLSRNIPT